MSYQGKQIRNSNGVEGTVGILCCGYPLFEHLFCFFFSSFFFFFQGYNIKKTSCVYVCVSLIIVLVYIFCTFSNWIVCLLLNFECSLYNLDTSPLLDIWFTDTFSSSVPCCCLDRVKFSFNPDSFVFK